MHRSINSLSVKTLMECLLSQIEDVPALVVLTILDYVFFILIPDDAILMFAVLAIFIFCGLCSLFSMFFSNAL